MILRNICALFALILVGCDEYADIASPVEITSRRIAGPGICVVILERHGSYTEQDTSETCWDGTKPHMVEYSRPRTPGLDCGQSTWMPEDQIVRRYGCSKIPYPGYTVPKID